MGRNTLYKFPQNKQAERSGILSSQTLTSCSQSKEIWGSENQPAVWRGGNLVSPRPPPVLWRLQCPEFAARRWSQLLLGFLAWSESQPASSQTSPLPVSLSRLLCNLHHNCTTQEESVTLTLPCTRQGDPENLLFVPILCSRKASRIRLPESWARRAGTSHASPGAAPEASVGG